MEILVLRPSTAAKRFVAVIKGDESIAAGGDTAAEALGNLLSAQASKLDLTIAYFDDEYQFRKAKKENKRNES